MRVFFPRRKGHITGFLIVSVPALLAGLLVLFIALYFSPKPPLLRDVPFGQAILDRDGELLRLTLAADDKYRLFVPLSDINPIAVSAALHYEDRHFYNHPGINIFAMFRAICSNLFSGRKMGASTLSMQVARLTLKLDSSSLAGKFRQIARALLLERHYSKAEILEAYFNLAPYGGNIEGIEAASRIYFGQPAARLVEAECVALAIVPQNPVSRNPVTGKKFTQARERLWRELKPGEVMPPLRVASTAELPFAAPHLTTELMKGNGPGNIRSAIDSRLQKLLEKILGGFIQRGKSQNINNAAALLVDCESLDIVALAGSSSFFNASIQGQIDGSRARRSPGSTLKPFIYALALDEGLIHPMTILSDTPKSFGGYDPQNFDHGFLGPVPAATALRNSRNLPAINLSGRLAGAGLYGFLRRAGVNLPFDAAHYGLALTLGGAEMNMRELAALYAMLANKGIWRPLRTMREEKENAPQRLLSREASWLVLRMLYRENARIMSQGKIIPLYYKTGTSNGLRDAWTCGIFGHYALVVWVGNFDNSSNPLLVGALTALPLFGEIAVAVAMGENLTDSVALPDPALNVAEVEYCAITGDFDLEHCADKGRTWIIPGVSPMRSQNILRPVLIDRATGLRACSGGNETTEEIWMEFWPTEMLEVFEKAGVKKPAPPEWLAECADFAKRPPGVAPTIILPKKNVIYQRRAGESGVFIPLRASADADIKKLYWHAGDQFLGTTTPGETFFWHATNIGKTVIRVVDDAGRGTSQKFLLETAP